MKNSELLARSGVYDAIIMQMVGYQQAYLGGYIFKQSVRKKRPSEDSQLWNDLIKNTVAQPVCRYIVDTINEYPPYYYLRTHHNLDGPPIATTI